MNTRRGDRLNLAYFDMRNVLLTGCERKPLDHRARGFLLPWRVVAGREYGRQMPTVYVKADHLHRTRFHRDPGCRELIKPSARGGDGNPVIATELDEVTSRPCLRCYPDAPHLDIVKVYCAVCNNTHACAHNGGVQVIDRGGRKYWMWPDNNSFRFLTRSA